MTAKALAAVTTILLVLWLQRTNGFLRISATPSRRRTTETPTVMAVIEVETKFRIDTDTQDDDVRARLRHLGFLPVRRHQSKKHFVDHYYDHPSLKLSLNDTWLRFRAVAVDDGQWQLKRGGPIATSSSSSSAVYEEIEGDQAVSKALSTLGDALPKNDNDCSNSYFFLGNAIKEEQEYSRNFLKYAPPIPSHKNRGLIPFCSLETFRESWELQNDKGDQEHRFVGLRVDLDQTNLGYTVGEVEKIVETKTEVAKAKLDVDALIDKILQGRPKLDPPQGKLEHYLRIHRPDHYQALIEKGVLKEKQVTQ